MQITIDVPDSVLHEAVVRMIADSLKGPTYGGSRNGAGYERILAQVNNYAETLDCTELIRRIASQQLDTIVRDVVRTEVARRVKTIAKQEAESGTLFEAIPEKTLI